MKHLSSFSRNFHLSNLSDNLLIVNCAIALTTANGDTSQLKHPKTVVVTLTSSDCYKLLEWYLENTEPFEKKILFSNSIL